MNQRGVLKTATGRTVPVMHRLSIDRQGIVAGLIVSPRLQQEDLTCGPDDRLFLQLLDGRRLVLFCTATVGPLDHQFVVTGHLDRHTRYGVA